MLAFYQNLKSWRLFRGLTQEELADRSGISRPNIAAIERGRRDCTLSTLHRLSFALELTPGTLLDQKPPHQDFEGLKRDQIDQVARDLIIGTRDLPVSLLEIRDQAAQQVGPLLRAAGIRRKGRIRKRLLPRNKKEVNQILERVSRLLSHFSTKEIP